jgi:hypothetical protein
VRPTKTRVRPRGSRALTCRICVELKDVAGHALASLARSAGRSVEGHLVSIVEDHLVAQGAVSRAALDDASGDAPGLTGEQEAWLAAFARERSVTRASIACRVSTNQPYVWSSRSPAFASRFREARAESRRTPEPQPA